MNYKIILFFVVLVSIYSCKKDKYAQQELYEINDFGENKGNLKMYVHEPTNTSTNMPLVVILHGCTQNALQIAEATEWNRLADKYDLPANL